MARYDVFRAPDGPGWLLDVQADLLSDFGTRVVVPLLDPKDTPPPIARLNPVFEVEGQQAVMMTQTLAAVPATVLKTPVANFVAHHDDITNALDMLLHGF